MIENIPQQKAWIIAVSMGYGHQRTAHPLNDLGQIINANNYGGIPKNDRRIWETSRRFYEFISDFKRIPLIGEFFFRIFDRFQKIWSFYPKRDLSHPTIQLRQVYSLIKRGWGKHLIDKIKTNPLPLISTFFTPAFMAEIYDYPGEIYCVVCDADISRTWAPLNPQTSKIKYFAPNFRVVERLRLYGVKKENIFFTGYPLPKENINSSEILKHDLGHRLLNLDPKGKYRQQYDAVIKKYLINVPDKSNHPLTIMFSIGGAGAQKILAAKVVKSLAGKIREGKIRIVLSVGTRAKTQKYFFKYIKRLRLGDHLGKNLEILWAPEIGSYFQKFNQALRTTDILWTKPSELSFYTALGLPIIIAPTIGSQEDFNRDWLLQVGSAMAQQNLTYTDQWLFDFLESGWFAEAAMDGFVEVEKMGTYNIENIISKM